MTQREYIEKMEAIQAQKRLEKQNYYLLRDKEHTTHRNNVLCEDERFHTTLAQIKAEHTTKLEALIDRERDLRMEWAECRIEQPELNNI